MKSIFTRLFLCAAALCSVTAAAQEKIILLNEGNWQADNGRMTYFADGKIVSNEWFRQVNGTKLGDTPNDIIQINDNLLAIAVNWSNIVQFITPEGKAVAATEDVPNNRQLASDGRYVYVSSYGHECLVNGSYQTFTKGFVAKIDISTFKVVDAVEVGYEPEGIACYKGYLFVANSGGYAFQEDHEYETTVSMIDAATMEVKRSIDTGQINLCGELSRSGQYLCVNSPGDYYDVAAATIILDCEAAIAGRPDSDCFVKLDYASTCSCTDTEGNFYAVGSRFNYYTQGYEFNYVIINPAQVMSSDGTEGVSEDGWPGTVLDDLKKISMPYSIYVNPYTGYIYATDAGSFAAAGKLVQWSPQGKKLGEFKVYINPAHPVALPPDGHFPGAVDDIIADPDAMPDAIYNLQGIRVSNPQEGGLYISKGKKFIYHSK